MCDVIVVGVVAVIAISIYRILMLIISVTYRIEQQSDTPNFSFNSHNTPQSLHSLNFPVPFSSTVSISNSSWSAVNAHTFPPTPAVTATYLLAERGIVPVNCAISIYFFSLWIRVIGDVVLSVSCVMSVATRCGARIGVWL